eukprot:1161920-Pelagomonas_calceolata.AAC.4
MMRLPHRHFNSQCMQQSREFCVECAIDKIVPSGVLWFASWCILLQQMHIAQRNNIEPCLSAGRRWPFWLKARLQPLALPLSFDDCLYAYDAE